MRLHREGAHTVVLSPEAVVVAVVGEAGERIAAAGVDRSAGEGQSVGLGAPHPRPGPRVPRLVGE